ERFKVQFTASQEYVDLLQQAKDLSSHALPNGSIEQLHLQAMRLFVAELKKRRCAEVKRPRATASDPRQHQRESQRDDVPAEQRQRQRQSQRDGVPAEQRQRQRQSQRDGVPAEQRQRQRESVRAAVRREVWQRDGARCTYVDDRGQRCREMAFLELHHVSPHALGGPPTADNL